jgi:membrane-associated phospholipid phosphatase
LTKNLAKIISIVFHPVFLSPILVSFILLHNNSILLQGIEKKLLLLIIFLIFVTILPVLSIFIFSRTKLVSDFELSERKERHLPYISCVLYYGALFQLLFGLSIPLIYSGIALAGCCVLIVLFFVNLKWKISAHTAGAGTTLGVIFYHLLYQGDKKMVITLFAPACIIAGLIGFSRLKLKQHSNGEVYAGYSIGIVVSLVSLYAYTLGVFYFYMK